MRINWRITKFLKYVPVFVFILGTSWVYVLRQIQINFHKRNQNALQRKSWYNLIRKNIFREINLFRILKLFRLILEGRIDIHVSPVVIRKKNINNLRIERNKKKKFPKAASYRVRNKLKIFWSLKDFETENL